MFQKLPLAKVADLAHNLEPKKGRILSAKGLRSTHENPPSESRCAPWGYAPERAPRVLRGPKMAFRQASCVWGGACILMARFQKVRTIFEAITT